MVDKTVDRFSECGIFRHGFVRIRCPRCREEYLLAFSCKTRYFCPSCQAKRVAAFVEWITSAIFQEVPHRQLVWTIPDVLPPTFRRDRKLLGQLSRAGGVYKRSNSCRHYFCGPTLQQVDFDQTGLLV